MTVSLVKATRPRFNTPGGTIWVCLDCLYSEANGEDPDPAYRPDSEPDVWALWPDGGGEITMGALDHECRDDDGEIADDCECERMSFSWSACEGCGSTLGGERHAFTYWTE